MTASYNIGNIPIILQGLTDGEVLQYNATHPSGTPVFKGPDAFGNTSDYAVARGELEQ